MLRKPTQIIGLAVLLLSATPFISQGQCDPPSITTQPTNISVCEGDHGILTVASAGTSITYQWEVNTGSGFTALTNTGQYSGTTTNTLDISGVTASMSSYQYRCVIDGACTPSVESDIVGMSIHTTPAITTQAANRTICSGANTTFAIVTTGAGITYQWQVNTGSGYGNIANGGIYSGATTATLTITGATALETGNRYRCIVTNECNTLTGTNRLLTVRALPAIGTQPQDETICAGSNTSFSVTATGAGLTYRWQMDDGSGSGFVNMSETGIYSGTQTKKLDLTAAPSTTTGYKYRCVVSGTCSPSVTSDAAEITVHDAQNITSQPVASVICDGENTTFTIAATGTALKYQWQVNDGSGFVNVTNTGIYGGAKSATLTLTGATTAENGYIYRCKVSNACGNLNSNDVILTVNGRPVITGQPANAVTCAGSTTTYTVTNTGTGMSYKWQVNTGSGFADITNGGNYSDATTATLTVSNAALSMSGYIYRCILDNGNCTKTTGTATLTVNSLPAITTQPVSAIICDGGNTGFSTAATGTAISYRWQVNDGSGFVNITNGGIYSGATTTSLSLTGASLAVTGYKYRCVVSGTCIPEATTADVTLTVNALPSISAQPVNKTVCTGVNAGFAITASGTGITYKWQENTGSGFADLSNGGLYSGVNTNSLTLTAPTAALTGYRYRCIVSGTCTPAVTSADAQLIVHDVKVTMESGSTTVCESNDALFTMTAFGVATGYQWQVLNGAVFTNITNGLTYSGTNTNTLTVLTPADNMTGKIFRCVVTGMCTKDTTSDMTLSVNDMPEITADPVSVSLKEGLEAVMSVQAHGYDFHYYWQATTDDGNTFVNIRDNGTYSGTTTNTLTIHNVAVAQNGYSYRCIVKENGACNFIADSSSWADLNVISRLSVADKAGNNTNIRIYPNPVSGSVLNVNMPVSGNIEVRITNMVGNVLVAETISAKQGDDSKITVGNLPAGIYLLHLANGDTNIGQPIRFTKQ